MEAPRRFLRGAGSPPTGWGTCFRDRPAIDRLLLAGEEAALFLIERSAPGSAGPIHVSGRAEGGSIVVEMVSGPGAGNYEALVGQLQGDRGMVEEAGLRILRNLVSEVHHLQFHQGDVLQIHVESKPLG